MTAWEKLGLTTLILLGLCAAFWINFGLFLAVHGNTFYHGTKPTQLTTAQVYQRDCEESIQGQENGVANTGSKNPAQWTCAIPKGETKN